jgi:hypothetical protein
LLVDQRPTAGEGKNLPAADITLQEKLAVADAL